MNGLFLLQGDSHSLHYSLWLTEAGGALSAAANQAQVSGSYLSFVSQRAGVARAVLFFFGGWRWGEWRRSS